MRPAARSTCLPRCHLRLRLVTASVFKMVAPVKRGWPLRYSIADVPALSQSVLPQIRLNNGSINAEHCGSGARCACPGVALPDRNWRFSWGTMTTEY